LVTAEVRSAGVVEVVDDWVPLEGPPDWEDVDSDGVAVAAEEVALVARPAAPRDGDAPPGDVEGVAADLGQDAPDDDADVVADDDGDDDEDAVNAGGVDDVVVVVAAAVGVVVVTVAPKLRNFREYVIG
jgi:hypothetical protein